VKYIVDQRAGCVGIIDTSMERTRNGLSRQDPETVWFRFGFRVPNICPTCNHERGGEWSLDPKIVEEAIELCRCLNTGEIAACQSCNRISCICKPCPFCHSPGDCVCAERIKP
jgi:hypothetical protein